MTESRGKPDHAWRRWLWAGAAAAAITLAPVRIVAQEAPLIRLAFDDQCASSGSTALGDALLARMPDARFGAGEGGWTLAWTQTDSVSCELVLTRDGVEQRMPLASSADADELEQAASRIAWWLASEAPASTDEPGVDDTAPAEVVEVEPERPELRRVPFVASLTPSLSAPSLSEPVRTKFGLHIIGSAEEELDGLELALGWNHLRGWGRGVQVAYLGNMSDDEFTGAQFSMMFNIARGPFNGAQFAFVNVAKDELTGAQFGTVNVARDVRGAQFGFVNTAREVRGAQFGFVNVADSSDASVGLISVVRDQPLYVNAGWNASSMVTLGLRHGSRHVQNIVEVEIDTEFTDLMTVGYGVGGHYGRGNVFGELDILARGVFNSTYNSDLAFRGVQAQLRATVGYRIARRLAVVGGPTYTVFAARKGRVDRVPSWSSVLYDDPADADVLLGWVGAYVGLRF
jgi:hypothetical protein